MRILLFAYEFPPVSSPQSLRWYYLANELGELGVEVDVLTTSLPDIWGFEQAPHRRVTVHRCFPGPFLGLSGWLSGDRDAMTDAQEGASVARCTVRFAERVYRTCRSVLNHLLLPDVRTEWLPFAWRAARRLHRTNAYDAVISSHEPGVDLLLGLRAKRRWALPWVADLGDPLLTPYTPRWRRRLDGALERKVCREADALLVTNERVADLLVERHGISPERITVVRQGFDRRVSGTCDLQVAGNSDCGDRFLLVYTGTFYREFRDPTPLIEALHGLSDVHLAVAGDVGPFAVAFEALGAHVTLHGKLPHQACLDLQRRADVLVNLGNTQDYQIPGKVYEYFGAGRPVLHIAGGSTDPVTKMLAEIRRGVITVNEVSAIRAAVVYLHQMWTQRKLEQSFDLSGDKVEEYSWEKTARSVRRVLQDCCVRAEHVPMGGLE